MEEGISELSQDSDAEMRIIHENINLKTKKHGLISSKLKLKRKSQPPAEVEYVETTKKFYLAKKVIQGKRRNKVPLPGSLEYDIIKGENKFLKK